MRKILENLINGKITIDQCENLLKANNIMEISNVAKMDMSREDRTGFPEVILAEGKSYDHLLEIIKKFFSKKKEASLLISRLYNDVFEDLENDLKYLKEEDYIFDYNLHGRILTISNKPKPVSKYGKVGIITAGTSDIPVAEEAKVILEEGELEVCTSYDLGVAGIHRLFPSIANLIQKDVKIIIVCAGMEGALPSVVAGVVDVPVIAVPTSVGYGVGEGGKTALNAMLQSCSPGIAVVNIDNGFGAAVFALTMVKSMGFKEEVE